MKTISHLLQLLKERDATIAKLEQQIELLKVNSTSGLYDPLSQLQQTTYRVLET